MCGEYRWEFWHALAKYTLSQPVRWHPSLIYGNTDIEYVCVLFPTHRKIETFHVALLWLWDSSAKEMSDVMIDDVDWPKSEEGFCNIAARPGTVFNDWHVDWLMCCTWNWLALRSRCYQVQCILIDRKTYRLHLCILNMLLKEPDLDQGVLLNFRPNWKTLGEKVAHSVEIFLGWI